MHEGSSFSVSRVPLLSLVAGVGLTIGFLVPVVHELSEKPWNRTRLLGMERAAMVTVVVACGLGVLEFWHVKRFGGRRKKGSGTSLEPSFAADEGSGLRARPVFPDERPRKMQFKLWQLFVGMTLAAVVLGVVKWLGISWASGLVGVVVLGVLAWGLFQQPRLQLRAGAVVAALFCPLVWMVAYNVPFGRTSGLVSAIPFAPAILPAALVRRLFTPVLGIDGMVPLAVAIVIAELLVGAWLAWRGGKLFVAWLLLVLLVSSVSSFIMHALYRA